MPAESDEYPVAARVITDRMRRARVGGLDEAVMSTVSMEVAQLSLECVETTTACYGAVGREVGAAQMLFARIEPGLMPDQVKVTVTLFDVATAAVKRAAVKMFSSEGDIPNGIAAVVEEATKS